MNNAKHPLGIIIYYFVQKKKHLDIKEEPRKNIYITPMTTKYTFGRQNRTTTKGRQVDRHH